MLLENSVLEEIEMHRVPNRDVISLLMCCAVDIAFSVSLLNSWKNKDDSLGSCKRQCFVTSEERRIGD